MNRQNKRQGLRKAVRTAQAAADRIGPVDLDYDHKADMDELAGEGGAIGPASDQAREDRQD